MASRPLQGSSCEAKNEIPSPLQLRQAFDWSAQYLSTEVTKETELWPVKARPRAARACLASESCLVLTIFLGQTFGIHMGWSGPSRNMCGTVGASRMTLQMEK